MAVLVLGAVGAGIGGAIGGTFLGMSAAGIGWMLGSTLGNLLSQKDQSVQGPRQSDLSVQASTYGAMLPVLRGTMRCAGNVIWSTPKQEVATTTEVGGKGGPSVSQTTYSYHVNMAVALCEGTMAGIRKIWSNGKLIYDASTGITAASAMASSVRAQAMRFYPGTETQLPDPTIEAALGAGNAPAYRGTCYVVFDQLDCPNGQVPQLHFEVVETVSYAAEAVTHTQLPGVTLANAVMVSGPGTIWAYDGGSNTIWRLGTNAAVKAGVINQTEPYNVVSGWRPAVGSGSRMLRWVDVAGRWYIEQVNLSDGVPAYLAPDDATTTDQRLLPDLVAFDPIGGQYVTISTVGELSTRFIVLPSQVKGPVISAGSIKSLAFYSGVVYVALNVAGDIVVNRYSASTGAFINGGTVATPLDIAANHVILSVGEDGAFVYLHKNDSVLNHPSRVYRLQDDLSVTLLSAFELGVVPVWAHIRQDYSTVGFEADGTGVKTRLVRHAPMTPVAPALADVVADVCARSGLDPAQVDASALSASVPGYGITRQGSGRAALDPLMTAWFVDASEVDGQIVFAHRADKTPVATIGWDQLGAGADGPQSEAAPLERTQEAELPRSVSVTVLNTAADYQSATEPARRHNAASVNDQALDLPVATTTDHAAAVAQGLLYTAWTERNRRKVSLTRRWAALDAGDIVTLETAPGQFGSMIIQRATDDGTTIALELADADVALLAAPGYGASPDSGQDAVQGTAPTGLLMLDVPLLREQDNDAGLYVALYPIGTGWAGAALYAGQGAGQLQQQGAVTQGAPVGFAASALPAWASSLMDETSRLTVQLTAGALYSTTRAQQLDANANICLLGQEVISFRTAADLGNGLYQLSGLMRGLRGTERHRATHQVGEPFALLGAGGLLRVPLAPGQIGVEYLWRAATFGQTIADATTLAHTPRGESAKPLAPVNPRKALASGGALTVTWDRRTRSLQDFPANGVDVPLFEASEAYEVDIFTDATFATVLRTLATTAPAVTYTAAQQVADFGATQASVHLRIHQIGAAGRGHHLQYTS